jgi:hypothetical protein
MLRELCLAMTIPVLPFGHAFASAIPNLGGNAALKYWQAFATLPMLTEAEQSKLNAEIRTMPLDGHAKELVTKAYYALQKMHRGAALPRCDWAIGWEEEGLNNLLPHAQASRVLGSLACLRARLRFEEGRNGEAIEDLIAAMTLGRHVSLDGSLVTILLGYQIEHQMSETLALHLPNLDAKTVKALKKRLDALPHGGSLASGVREEQTLETGWFVRQVKEAKDKETLLSLLSPLLGSEEAGKGRDLAERARSFLDECGGSGEEVLRLAEETRQSYALMAKKLELPMDQFEKEWEPEAKKHAGNPVFRALTPAIIKCRRRQAQADVHRALLSAALAVQLDGREALKNHADPVGGGPFEYVAFDGGYDLRSKFKGQDDKPLVLTVGQHGK